MIHFLRLIRPVNLLIIAATMYSVGAYFDVVYNPFHEGEFLIQTFNFFLLVISTVFIAAAGNIINDYFDVRADRINRPEGTIIMKHIKRRWAIVFHWILNFVAFGIAIHLSFTLNTFWYVFIHLLSINLLWFYSMQLKRTLVIGNVVIALLTALVPVLVGIYYQDYFRTTPIDSAYPFYLDNYQFFPIYVGIGLGVFAFVLNWTREIIKDMEDIYGDREMECRTLPIVWGIKAAKIIVVSLIGITTFILLFINFAYIDFEGTLTLRYTLFGLILPFAWVIYLIIKAKHPVDYHRISMLIKFVMVLGLLYAPVFYFLLARKTGLILFQLFTVSSI